MNSQRFKSALRSALGYAGEGLIWSGVLAGMNAAIAAEVSTHARNRARAGQSSMTALSIPERTEWAALVERLR